MAQTSVPTEPGENPPKPPRGSGPGLADPPPPPGPTGVGALDRYFRISARGSSVGRELRGGLTTFMAMAYILLLNPILLGGKDVEGHRLDPTQITTMTALAAFVTTVAMGLIGNVPLALAAGLSVAGVVGNQVATQMTWPQAMGLCVIYGLIIMLMVVSGLRERIMNAIPMALKHAITIGIGLFIAMIGLNKAGVVSKNPAPGAPVTLGPAGELAGWPVLVFAVTVLAIFMLLARNVRGAILIGLVFGTLLAMVINTIVDIPDKTWGGGVPNLPDKVIDSPDFGLFGDVSVFGGFAEAGGITASVLVFTLVFAGFFDAMATIIGIGTEANLVDDKGRMPGLSKALAIDGAGGIIGGVTSSSGQTVFIESATGVGDGARTGLSSVVTGGIFGLMLFFTPLAGVVPDQVAAAALVVIGSMMITQVKHIDWDDKAAAIPAFLTIVLMPFTYSITAGVAAGVIVYTLIKIAQGRFRDIGPLMWVLTAAFLIFFALHPIKAWLGVT
ncbi:NCS2 family permease [Embleya sp. AB8]|uniref:NCS2 family permease n=1 Tax=Embleya sp. AB8 TaxID=3156304 RepID=UPI003C76A8EC